jgi:hypothetical protein
MWSAKPLKINESFCGRKTTKNATRTQQFRVRHLSEKSFFGQWRLLIEAYQDQTKTFSIGLWDVKIYMLVKRKLSFKYCSVGLFRQFAYFSQAHHVKSPVTFMARM